MAKTKNSTKTESAPKAETRRKKTSPTVEPQAPPPDHSRGINAAVLLALTVFVSISLFNTDGAVIAFIADLFKGLVGWGYWLCAPVFLLSAILLLTQKNKPVVFRISCAMLIPLIFSAMVHLFAGEDMLNNFEFQTAVTTLFNDGQKFQSGGVLGGLLAIGMNMAFSVYGSAPILLAVLAALLIISVRGSFAGLFKASEKKEREPKAEKMPKSRKEPVFAAAPEFSEKPEKKSRKQKKAEAEAAANARAADAAKNESMPKIQRFTSADMMDIPLGEEENELGFNNLDFKNTYDQIVEEQSHPAKAGRKKGKGKAEDEENLFPPMTSSGMMSVPKDENGFREFSTEGFLNISEKDEGSLKPVALGAEISDPPRKKKPSRKDLVNAEAMAVEAEINAASDAGGYSFPPVELLRGSTAAAVDASEEIMLNRSRLESAIRSFGINAAIVGSISGPTVTRYDIELEQGVKLSKITNLAGDLALALGVANVRIAPIPDKISTVGIEVPNKIVSTVYLRDVIDSAKFKNAKSKLSFALGKDISGDCIVGNISKLPHMLIAGTTGSGKSVCMNSLILSLLYKARPDEVRLIMIDPKMVELGIYNGIPHLFVPVVTDPKKAAGALQWSVVEMLKRYRLFSEVGVRDLTNYNKYCETKGEETLPRIVIVIDELADLMMAASKEVEESICRVAQMGRAAGMHLIIATQRPSADVITGLMKANIPSRIAFAVSSAMESRIILDQAGAEKLIGMGDMLFAPVGCRKPIRIQGAFVTDEEREDVIQFIKKSCDATAQNNEIEEFMNKAVEEKSSADSSSASDSEGFADYDEMLPHAVEVVLEMGSCSVSMLQRRVKLGYSRAARIVDQMEELGIVGPYEGAKPRQVLIDRAGWHDIQVELGLASDDDMNLAAEMSEDSDYED